MALQLILDGKQNLDMAMVKNNDIRITFQVKTAVGATVDLTGYTNIIWSLIRPKDKRVMMTKSLLGGDITLSNPTAGFFTFQVDAEDTIDFPPEEYLHEAVTIDADGNVVTLTNNDPGITAGRFILRQQYTVQP